MKKVERLLKLKKISKIIETEKGRYLNFFANSYRENLLHCKEVLERFPRWSMVSGYYAMHDIVKLFLADKFNLKIDFNVHKTTIEVFGDLIEDKEIVKMLLFGYDELIRLMNDLATAKEQRTKLQYYTGTEFMKEKYRKESREFLEKTVLPFIEKIRRMNNDKFN